MSCYVIDRHNFTEKTHDLECRRCNVAMFFINHGVYPSIIASIVRFKHHDDMEDKCLISSHHLLPHTAP